MAVSSYLMKIAVKAEFPGSNTLYPFHAARQLQLKLLLNYSNKLFKNELIEFFICVINSFRVENIMSYKKV